MDREERRPAALQRRGLRRPPRPCAALTAPVHLCRGRQRMGRLPPGEAAYLRSARAPCKTAPDVLPGRRQPWQAADEADPPKREQQVCELPRERALDPRERSVPYAPY